MARTKTQTTKVTKKAVKKTAHVRPDGALVLPNQMPSFKKTAKKKRITKPKRFLSPREIGEAIQNTSSHVLIDGSTIEQTSDPTESFERYSLSLNRQTAIDLSNINKNRKMAREAYIASTEFELEEELTTILTKFLPVPNEAVPFNLERCVRMSVLNNEVLEKVTVTYLEKLITIKTRLRDLQQHKVLEGSVVSAIFWMTKTIDQEIFGCKRLLAEAWKPLRSSSHY